MVPTSLVFKIVQDKTAFTQKPFERLMDLIHKMQWRDTFYATFNAEIDWKHNGKGAARH